MIWSLRSLIDSPALQQHTTSCDSARQPRISEPLGKRETFQNRYVMANLCTGRKRDVSSESCNLFPRENYSHFQNFREVSFVIPSLSSVQLNNDIQQTSQPLFWHGLSLLDYGGSLMKLVKWICLTSSNVSAIGWLIVFNLRARSRPLRSLEARPSVCTAL